MVNLIAVVLIAFVNEVLGYYSRNHIDSSDTFIKQCILECPKTKQYDPVCGSDSLQYFNIGYLTCAQYCGADVTQEGTPPCKRPLLPVSRDNEQDVIECIQNCHFRTSEYNPVCGSDGRQYTNMSELRCASSCGVVVEMLHPAPCP